MSSDLEKQQANSYLSGGNVAYIDSLYEDYLANPKAVDSSWQAIFEAWSANSKEISHKAVKNYFLYKANSPGSVSIAKPINNKQAEVTNLINAYRAHGHHIAKLDPLNITPRIMVPSLDLSYYHLTNADLNESFEAGKYLNAAQMSLKDILSALQATYCGSIGVEYLHISNTEEIDWLQEKLESVHGRANFSKAKKKQILADLIAADGLEKYLGLRYVGQKRFSLEGGDSLIPMMKEIIEISGEKGVKEIIIGMAHRGRLNVLVNVLGKEPNQLFQEFEGKIKNERTGDVKYHMGFSSDIETTSKSMVHLALAFNPSHLEIIGPVVEGSVRCRLRRRQDLQEKNTVIPVIIHGDAAFAGQGVVMETFNFSQARGYSTGGTIHIVINNQIGFTTSNPLDARSTLYCTDVAKIVQAPVLHVNGNDPEAVVFATQLAFDFRKQFKRDIVIDLVCYRRHGHNEADEPSVTQPLMYQKIKNLLTVRELYAETLIQANIVTADEVIQQVEEYRNRLDKGQAVVRLAKSYKDDLAIDWTPYCNAKWTEKVDTTIDAASITKLSELLHQFPPSFELHPVVKRLISEREKMTLGELPMNWGYAETMAYASLLADGYGVRLSGQDSGRGTFAHRHAIAYEYNTGEAYIPLEKVAKTHQNFFMVIDSVLSEEAVLAFEYGYASSEPNNLILWEAQFGDFANGAQVVIDQFISSGEQKWGRLCGLVMLLPHGYEGQGPEHSSARLERFMQLCAQHNIQVCTPTTPAQIFHLLRRQMIRKFRKPLIIMTPKSLLRHKLAVSLLSDLSKGKFHNVIPEIDSIIAKAVERIILCGGKVYYDLLQKRRELALENVAIIRIEQLYPFPKKALIKQLIRYGNAKQVVWCQEEPKNQGVWFSSQHNIKSCLQPEQKLRYAGREFAAAPAVGSSILHAQQQQALVEQALLAELF